MEKNIENNKILNEIYSICKNLNCTIAIDQNKLHRYKESLIPDIMLSDPKIYIDCTIDIFKLHKTNDKLLNHLIHSIIVRDIYLENKFGNMVNKLSETIDMYFKIFKQLTNIVLSNNNISKKPKKINTKKQYLYKGDSYELKISITQNQKTLRKICNIHKDFSSALKSVNSKYKK